jgi:hypothetical protein
MKQKPTKLWAANHGLLFRCPPAARSFFMYSCIRLGALVAIMLCASSAAKAQDLVQIQNPTNVTVYYDYSLDGGARWTTNVALPPGQVQSYFPIGLPLKVSYMAGAERQWFDLPGRRGRVTEYYFWPIFGGGVDIYGPRR